MVNGRSSGEYHHSDQMVSWDLQPSPRRDRDLHANQAAWNQSQPAFKPLTSTGRLRRHSPVVNASVTLKGMRAKASTRNFRARVDPKVRKHLEGGVSTCARSKDSTVNLRQGE